MDCEYVEGNIHMRPPPARTPLHSSCDAYDGGNCTPTLFFISSNPLFLKRPSTWSSDHVKAASLPTPADRADFCSSVVVYPFFFAEIKYVSGSVEAACGLGLADAVVDLVETGTTMRVRFLAQNRNKSRFSGKIGLCQVFAFANRFAGGLV